MNVFYTNRCPIQSANEHCYVHVVKMLTEYCQMAATAHKLLDNVDKPFKPTHPNHPSAVWMRQSKDHYDWVIRCALRLSEIYTQKSGKIHKSSLALAQMLDAPKNIPQKGFTEPPVAADDKFKAIAVMQGAAIGYQHYLNSKHAEWRSRAKPMKVEFPVSKPHWVN